MNEIEVVIPKRKFLPCYRPLVDSAADINFLWGGRDSGKSHFVAQRLIRKCMKESFFRCVMVKKTAESIKDSQWQTIKDIVEEWGLSSLFRFKIAPLSIECVNGNRFIARGCDDAGNLKSIKDPTDVWYEEGNQLSRTDFITVATTLRSNKARTQQWFSFNPETDEDFEEFWLYKTFFDKKDINIYQSFTSTWSVDIPAHSHTDNVTGKVTFTAAKQVDFNYSSTWTTYHDNPYCKPERAAFLEQLAILDPYYYKVYTLGQWGNRKITDPFCLSYSKEKHVGITSLRRDLEVCLSFDFNKNPITCGVYQHEGTGEMTNIWNVEAIKLENSDIYKLCEYINSAYAGCIFLVTGDATGKGSTALVEDGINYYTVIKSKLNLGQAQLKVPTQNPRVRENRMLVNAVFHICKVLFDKARSKGLIFDCENVSVNDVGDIEKGDRSNPKKRADHLDNWRYYLNTFHKHVLKQ